MKTFNKKKLEKQLLSFHKKENKIFQITPLDNCQNYSKEYEKKGTESIKKGEVAFIILSGGMGSRLGVKYPKGFFKINKKTLFEHIFDKIKKEEEKYKKKLFVSLMTSTKNNEEIIQFFNKKNFFGLKKDQIDFFMQEDLPFLDENGQWVFENKKILYGPDGNGSFFEVFKKSYLLKKYKNKNIKYLIISFIDNPIFNPFDNILIGFHRSHQKDLSIISIKREKEKNMGALIHENGRIKILEYFNIEDIKKYKYLNTGIFCINLDFIEKNNFDIPYNHVRKTLKNGKNIYKTEKFIFDILNYASSSTICYPKDLCFCPLKTVKDKNILKKIL
ncbi:MAG: hypothetical protein AMS24_03705 [Chlamydiae bacterium SM23_39]|nr:MAG: hypothetical protein AMS24_03705 [Chlamydiae bacterium SM23_39]